MGQKCYETALFAPIFAIFWPNTTKSAFSLCFKVKFPKKVSKPKYLEEQREKSLRGTPQSPPRRVESSPLPQTTSLTRRVSIEIYEGERALTGDSHLLRKFDLTGIPHAPCGAPQIKLTFDIDNNGILKVFAANNFSRQKDRTILFL